jgi:hypothetical protein
MRLPAKANPMFNIPLVNLPGLLRIFTKFRLCAKEYEDAIALLADLPAGARGDEFVEYAVNRVHFEFAMHCLDTGDNRFSRYINAVPVMFALLPDSEKAFDRGKLNKASRMARESEYPEVHDSFFEFVGQSLSLLDKSGLSGDEKVVYLSELYARASSLGTHYRVMDELSMMLNLSDRGGAG